MGSSFGGINTALTSLYAQRRALDVTGQNIANANTEGYTRQRVDMRSEVGSLSPGMYAKTDGLGTGVSLNEVQRVRDEFLENRGRAEHGKSTQLATQSAAYTSIEDVFAEPSDTALAAQLREMWGSWNDVANNPQLTATRSTLLQQSWTVADQLNSASAALSGQWSDNRTSLSAYVTEVNTAADSIAQLNDSIVKAKANGLTVNELEDRRDGQVMKLSELTGATASLRKNGAMDVFVGNSTLVSEFTTRKLEVSGAARLLDQPSDPMTLRWADTKTAVQAGGTIGGMVDTMTAIIPAISDALDSVARNLADSVNALHQTGYSADGSTGLDFFTGTTAGTIKVAITNPDQVAVSGTTGALDNSVADALADLGDKSAGPDREYQAMIGQLGVTAQATTRRAEIQANVTEQVDAARESQSGVNLDEEMTNLLTYQRGYEAASRVLTTIDSMLDQLINRTGLVGR
ncbi:flagellar hook-associated protein FlgK [Jidongwangia harbinensis]|uniref:flagellar hook-associated protein FlgK n=1 Tax=Jidongwangia harbinensis TaxID=2878561 RepID=UPI001CDA1080|nr:flagellar hook-associated protein FlgK [Jidongwangia harbinensis]MCA2213724.1 flagellar hook-associated protein FlgK [Jidongwangia harbinensis]